MPFILLTSLISPNFYHIPQEKINPLLYFFAESTTKILSLSQHEKSNLRERNDNVKSAYS